MKYVLTLVADFAEGTATAKYLVDGDPPGIGETLWYNDHKYAVTDVHRWFKDSCWVEGCNMAQTVVEVVAEDNVVTARRSASVREPETKD